MLLQRSFGLVVLGSMLFGTGCIHGDYRVVKTVPYAGEVALSGPQQEAHEKAEWYMASRCSAGYGILEGGEAVVRQNAVQQTRNTLTLFGPAQNTQSSTTEKREWRIKYQCKGAATGTTTTTSAPQGMIDEVFVSF